MRTNPREFQVLRATVESQLQPPAVLLITSALPGDGKTEVATGLARAFGECEYRTVLVEAKRVRAQQASTTHRRATKGESANQLAVPMKNVSRISIPADGEPAVPQERLRNLIADLRRRYECVVVDAGEILPDALPMVRLVDGVLVVVRVGRRPNEADRQAAAALDRVGARVLGIVANGEPLPEAFDRMRGDSMHARTQSAADVEQRRAGAHA